MKGMKRIKKNERKGGMKECRNGGREEGRKQGQKD
jgi:hypothetical protein